MGFILFLLMGLCLVAAVIAFIRLAGFYSKKQLGKQVIFYGVLLSIFLHTFIFLKYVRIKEYWAFDPLFTQMNYLFFKPFVLSLVIVPLEFEKLSKLSKIILSSVICGAAFYYLALPPFMTLLYFIIAVALAFSKTQYAQFLNKIILISIISSLILSFITMPLLENVLESLSIRRYY